MDSIREEDVFIVIDGLPYAQVSGEKHGVAHQEFISNQDRHVFPQFFHNSRLPLANSASKNNLEGLYVLIHLDLLVYRLDGYGGTIDSLQT